MSNNPKTWNDVVVRYYGDTEFAGKFDANPASTLKEIGISIPDGANVTLHRNTNVDIHLVMPKNPVENLSEDFLGSVAAGYCGTDNSNCYE